MAINWYPGHMVKTKRNIQEKIDLIDVAFEVIDARIPYSSKNKDIDTIVKNKPKIIIMTKIDLCDQKKTNEWIEYYERLGNIVIPVDLTNNYNVDKIYKEIDKIAISLTEKRKKQGLQPRKVRALIVGIPNVGKSTLINRLVGKKATNVGNKPGITKQIEWIRVNNQVELLDSPGILWPKLDNAEVALNLASTTAIKEEILDLEEVSIYIIKKMLKEYPDNIKQRYNLSSEINSEIEIVSILDKIGAKVGAVRNNETNYDKVYTTIIKDLREGYLGKITFDNISC